MLFFMWSSTSIDYSQCYHPRRKKGGRKQAPRNIAPAVDIGHAGGGGLHITLKRTRFLPLLCRVYTYLFWRPGTKYCVTLNNTKILLYKLFVLYLVVKPACVNAALGNYVIFRSFLRLNDRLYGVRFPLSRKDFKFIIPILTFGGKKGERSSTIL